MSLVQLSNENTNGLPEPIPAHPWRSLIISKYPCAEFDRVVLPGAIVDAIVGEAVDIVANVTGGDVTRAVVRSPAPPGRGVASYLLTGNRLIPASPGRFDVLVQIAGWQRTIVVAAFPADVNKFLEYPQDGSARRRRLRAILKEATPETVMSALETGEKFDPASLSVLIGRSRDVPLNIRSFC